MLEKDKQKMNNEPDCEPTGIRKVKIFDAPENGENGESSESLVASVFDRIETECVKPRSKWYFVFKNELFWGTGLLCIIIGSISVAAGLFAVSYMEFDYYSVTHDSLISFLLDTLPLMWVACLIAFMVLGYVQIRHTRRGYKYSLIIIVGSTFALSIAGGTVLHAYGFGALLERAVGSSIPFHKSAFIDREQIWQKVERGVIAGEVIFIEHDNSSFVLKDLSGRSWLIESTDLLEMDIDILREEKMVRVIGLPTELHKDINAPNSMYACFILPWEMASSEKMALNNPELGSGIDLQNNNVLVNNPVINSERNIEDLRSNECKGVRPYQLMQKLRAEAK